MLIKASSITNLTDARYFAAKEVDFLGFNLEEGTPGYLDPVYMKAIREWVAGPKIIGEFDRTPAATVREAATFYGLDAVQVTRTDHLALLDGLEVMLYVPYADATESFFRETAPWVRWFLIDFTALAGAENRLAGEAPVWKHLFATYPSLLHLDVSPASLPALIGALQPAGLALQGGGEEQVGVKSFDDIDVIFEVLEMMV